jgi:hypothetical protein
VALRRIFPFTQRVFATVVMPVRRSPRLRRSRSRSCSRTPIRSASLITRGALVIARFFAWIGRNRLLAMDDSARLALRRSVMLLVRRIARAS